ncbi:major facilitator superfamily domain-containing protein 6-like protein b [Plakobranchus ocellatus]|uniref:Major facilitator superfamily domain-containing protein 6-like protein b n=1 Tax=Plakobranchus ocellatus TaxID=259542 RepID=A0AAV4BSG6_9GAST|nr:major facilitator superfamily domain-containing protein 6-like protein b [Plakobranchus ocellatus]
MAQGMETVNISKAATTTNLFYLFFHGGKAAIVPFLTLFFRLVGLSPLEAGLIIAAKTLTGLIWAPLWARCATAYSRHRFILMFSLFMMMLTYLSMPALYTQVWKPEHCQSRTRSHNDSAVGVNGLDPWVEHLLHSDGSSPAPTTSTPEATHTGSTKPPVISAFPENITQENHTAASMNSSQPTPSNSSTKKEELYDLLGQVLKNVDLHSPNLTAEMLYQELEEKAPGNFTMEEAESMFQTIHKHEIQKRSVSDDEAKPRNQFNAELKKFGNRVSENLESFHSNLQKDKLLLFLVILAVIVGGEIFSSPVEKVADDSWFDFLNRIDDLERYGQQRFWGSVAFVLVPIAVTVAVVNTPCFLPYNIHHFLLHFYVFTVCMCGALVVACCYPVPPPSSSRSPSKICKSLRLALCDCRGFFLSVTLLLTGMVYASYHNFLFWRIEDLGGSELVMGFCASLTAFGEIPMLIFSNLLVKRFGHSWMVSLCLLILALRLLYYAFIPFAWAIAPVELTHGVTHTALWFAVLSHDDFNSAGSLDRSLRTVLSSLYFGLGFSAGSVISGFIYYVYGSAQLFWGCSALIGGWLILFSLVQLCLPKKEKIRYIKLLRSDSDNSDEDDDDWLEMALKER